MFPPTNADIVQRFFCPHRSTLLHRLIAVECEVGFRSIVDGYGVDTLRDHLSFYLKSRTTEHDLHRICDKWCQDYLSSNPGEMTLFDERKLLVNILPLTSLTDRYFYILFGDRQFLFKFNEMLTHIVKMLKARDYPSYIRKDGRIKRPASIPKWLQKGIVRRDRGHCVYCNKDLSGIWAVEHAHYDHLFALAEYGTNDPANFQLLCQDCNLSKSSNRWFPPDENLRFW